MALFKSAYRLRGSPSKKASGTPELVSIKSGKI